MCRRQNEGPTVLYIQVFSNVLKSVATAKETNNKAIHRADLEADLPLDLCCG